MHDLFALITPPVEINGYIKRIAPVMLLALFWCWETWRPFFGQKEGRLKHAGRNLAIAVINIVVLGLAFGYVMVVVTDWTQENRLGLLNNLDLGWGWYCWIAGCTSGTGRTTSSRSCGGSTGCTTATGTWT